MIDAKEKERMMKVRNTYSVLATVPIILSLIHVLGQVIVQSTISLTDGVFNHPIPLSFTFGSSMFATMLASQSMEQMLVSQLPSIIAIVFTLALIILSSTAMKGKTVNVLIAAIIYGIDTILLFLAMIMTFNMSLPIEMSVADIIVNLIIHVAGMGTLIYGTIYSRKMEDIFTFLAQDDTKGALYQAPEEK